MSYLGDTDVMSDAMKPRPDERAKAWMQAHESDLYTSAITNDWGITPRHRASAGQ